MSRVIVALWLAILCAGCERDAHKPEAELTYIGINRVANNVYAINYTSNMDLLNIFSRAEGEGQLSTMLICSLDGDPVFSRDHVIEKRFEGLIGVTGQTPGPPYVFSTEGTFNYVYDKLQSQRVYSPAELRKLLLLRPYIICKAAITVFGYTGYHSKPMRVPTADIVRDIDTPFRQQAPGYKRLVQ